MQETEKIDYGQYYHIYNRGINSCDLFKDAENYEYFLKLYDKYIIPVADTYAWVLMPNHFHFLLRVKDEFEIFDSNNTSPSRASENKNLPGFKNLEGLKPIHQHLSNLFNAYTKAFNKRHNRHGSLFEKNFKRKLIKNEIYLKQLLLYIHNNPVHHGFCEHPMEYNWSSYLSCISLKPTKLKRNNIIGWFDDLENFKSVHNQKIEIIEIEKFLEI
ncbi:MAG: transposase [Bacteroidales bacterium]